MPLKSSPFHRLALQRTRYLHPGLSRWVHRFLPPPPLRCAHRALRSGGGSLLWTTWTIRNAVAQVSRQTPHRQIATDFDRHRQQGGEAVSHFISPTMEIEGGTARPPVAHGSQ